VIRTDVSLRPYTSTDADSLKILFSDPEVVRYVGDGKPLVHAALKLFEKILDKYERDPAFFIWAIQEDGEYAGHAELKRRAGRSEYEIIYILQRSRWGRTLGSRVVNLLLQEARTRSIPFVIATVHPENVGSIVILQRRGFVLHGALSTELQVHTYRLDLEFLKSSDDYARGK
jgi:[ribosomal protein S5]-alanine N-acetyltransferase